MSNIFNLFKKEKDVVQNIQSNIDSIATNNLGDMYAEGNGVPQSDKTAVEWYKKAAELGNSEAMTTLGFMYENGLGVAQSDKTAVEWYEKAAELGNSEAMTTLGTMYENGDGVPQSDKTAVEWYEKAAELGNSEAMTTLGFMYESGNGVPQSDKIAVEWYEKAAELGNSEAMTTLGAMYENGDGVPQSDKTAVEWFRKAAELGDSSAMNNLGLMYESGKGVPQSDKTAVEWYEKAAKLGNSRTINYLGVMYANGTGVPQSNKTAVEWYEKAAELGNSEAMNNLGIMYANGTGVPQSDKAAVEWYKKAAELGNSEAMNNLGIMYANGTGVPQSDKAAVEWYEKAAELGDSSAMNNLGLMYESGKGVPQSDKAAAEWYEKAAELGNSEAMNNLGIKNPIFEKEEKCFMMRPYQDFKELVLSRANSIGVKQGKISLKCLYWYLMYKGEITSEEYDNCDSFSYPGYKAAFSNKSRIEDILLNDLLQNHIKQDGLVKEETDLLKGLIAIGKDSLFEWIDIYADRDSLNASLTKYTYERMSYEYFTLDDIDNPNKYDFESIYLYPGEYPIHKFFIEVKENRVVSRDTDYIGFRSFFKGLRAGSYHSVSSSNYEWVNVMSCVDCYITNQRIILMGVNNLTSANETKVIQLSSITRVVQEDSDLEIIRQNKNIRLDIYDKQDMALCKLILGRLLNGSYDVNILPKDFYMSNNARIVFSENYENQVEEVVEKINNFFEGVSVQSLKTDSDNTDLDDIDKINIDDYKYKTKNIIAISLAVNSAENSQYFHSLIKENKEEWVQIIDAAFLILKSYDISFWQYEFEIVDEWRTGQTKYILFSSVYLKDSIDKTENFDKYMDSIIEETDTILSNSYIKDNIVDLGEDKFSELKKYKELFDNNIITEEEFDTLKRRILDI